MLTTYEYLISAILSYMGPKMNESSSSMLSPKKNRTIMMMGGGGSFRNGQQLQNLDRFLDHKKERMFFMIINLLRMRPNIFMEQINAFKARCDMR